MCFAGKGNKAPKTGGEGCGPLPLPLSNGGSDQPASSSGGGGNSESSLGDVPVSGCNPSP